MCKTGCNYDVDLRWSVTKPPYVWLNKGHETKLGQLVSELDENERKKLADQIAHTIGRGKANLQTYTVFFIKGHIFEYCPASVYDLLPEHYVKVAK